MSGRGVTQTILAGQVAGVYGNCVQASVATMLDLPLDAVPHFAHFDWWQGALEFWARGKGLTCHWVYGTDIPDGLAMVCGTSPRGYGHAVVGQAGSIIWDPHPDRTGLSTIDAAMWFEPWKGDTGCFACRRTCDHDARPIHEHICPEGAPSADDPHGWFQHLRELRRRGYLS